MRRRDLLVSSAALGALPSAGLAAPAHGPAVDVAAVQSRVTRLRERMAKAGERTVGRYRRQLPSEVELPESLWTTIREGFGALSVVPSLRRMTPEEQQVPEALALVFDVADAAGAYFVHLHDALGEVLAHPERRHRAALGSALSRLADHEEDEEFGRSVFVSLRAERESIQRELAHTGPDALLERAHADLGAIITQARFHLDSGGEVPMPPDGAPPKTVGKTLARGLARLVGIALLCAAVVGAAWIVAAVYATFAMPICLPFWLLLGVLGGVVMVTAGAAGLGMLQAGRPSGPVKSLDGRRIHVNAAASWKWFATGAEFGERQPKVSVMGSVRAPGRPTPARPSGLPGTAADATCPAPGLPEYALVARVGEWIGLISGAGDTLPSAPREGELWLAVNVPAALADATRGAFVVEIRLQG